MPADVVRFGNGLKLDRTAKAHSRNIFLHLPDRDHAKSSVLNSLSSPHSRRNYEFAMEQFKKRGSLYIVIFKKPGESAFL